MNDVYELMHEYTVLINNEKNIEFVKTNSPESPESVELSDNDTVSDPDTDAEDKED